MAPSGRSPYGEHGPAVLDRTDGFDSLQSVVYRIYHQANDRWFDLTDLLTNTSKFTLRCAKAVRKSEPLPAMANLGLAMSWFSSAMNRLGLSISELVWERFPGVCATCGCCPCSCAGAAGDSSVGYGRPSSIEEHQAMFEAIYPAAGRDLATAALHLAEEAGELAEALLWYRCRHRKADLRAVQMESADYVSCVFGVANSLDLSLAEALSDRFAHGCHSCGQAPCVCSFGKVVGYEIPRGHRTGPPGLDG